MQSLHSGSSACLKSKAQTLDAKFAFWVVCLPKIQAQTLDAKFAFWVFCLPKNSRPKPWMQSFAFWVFCLHENSTPSLGCNFCILGLLPA